MVGHNSYIYQFDQYLYCKNMQNMHILHILQLFYFTYLQNFIIKSNFEIWFWNIILVAYPLSALVFSFPFLAMFSNFSRISEVSAYFVTCQLYTRYLRIAISGMTHSIPVFTQTRRLAPFRALSSSSCRGPFGPISKNVNGRGVTGGPFGDLCTFRFVYFECYRFLFVYLTLSKNSA